MGKKTVKEEDGATQRRIPVIETKTKINFRNYIYQTCFFFYSYFLLFRSKIDLMNTKQTSYCSRTTLTNI